MNSTVGVVSQPVGVVGSTTISSVAQTAEGVVTTAMQFEPMVAGMVSMFFPPAAIAQPFIVMAMPFVIRALDDIAKNNGGDMIGAFLSATDPSTQGSG
jgi:hypothetical protein